MASSCLLPPLSFHFCFAFLSVPPIGVEGVRVRAGSGCGMAVQGMAVGPTGVALPERSDSTREDSLALWLDFHGQRRQHSTSCVPFLSDPSVNRSKSRPVLQISEDPVRGAQIKSSVGCRTRSIIPAAQKLFTLDYGSSVFLVWFVVKRISKS